MQSPNDQRALHVTGRAAASLTVSALVFSRTHRVLITLMASKYSELIWRSTPQGLSNSIQYPRIDIGSPVKIAVPPNVLCNRRTAMV